MLNLTYTYRLKLTKAPAQTYNEWLETARRVWNFALAERKDWYKSRFCSIDACSLRGEYIIPPDAPRPTFASQCKALTQARKANPSLKSANAQMLQQVLRRVEKAFVGMWEQGHGFPRFKKPGRVRSLLFPQLGKTPIQGNKVNLPGAGLVRMRLSRPLPDGFVVKQAQVVKKASTWYVMLTLQADLSVPETQVRGQPLGIDVGLKSFLAASNGLAISCPKYFVNLQRKLRSLQQRASHKVKGSNNWKKAQLRVAKFHEHIRNRRQDWFYKLAHELCGLADTIFVEDLNFKTWAKGMFSKHTLDAAYGEFFRILQWVCWKRDVFFGKVNPNGTSQTCPQCGVHTGQKELSQRIHHCEHCGYRTDRDVAAAQVVMQRGLAAVGHTVKMLGERLDSPPGSGKTLVPQ